MPLTPGWLLWRWVLSAVAERIPVKGRIPAEGPRFVGLAVDPLGKPYRRAQRDFWSPSRSEVSGGKRISPRRNEFLARKSKNDLMGVGIRLADGAPLKLSEWAEPSCSDRD